MLHLSRLYSEEVINKLLNECVSTWEVKDRLEKLSDDDNTTLYNLSQQYKFLLLQVYISISK